MTKEDGTYKEPYVFINGEKLTDQQTSILRFALEHHLDNLRNEGLGNDDHGISMCKRTIELIEEIKAILYK